MAGDDLLPLSLQLTPRAKAEGIDQMQQWLERRSGRTRSREDARTAFENLFGVYVTLCEWKARADLEDRSGDAPEPAPPPRAYRRKKGSNGRRANTAE